MAQSLFDRLMPPRRLAFARETPFTLMALNALVFLDGETFIPDLVEILGADQVGRIPNPAPFVPSILFARSKGRVIVALEGTKSIGQWWQYVENAGVQPWGPAPGVCFSPFVDYCRRLQPEVNAQLEESDRVAFTGHSLGAACAGMLNSEQTRAGWWTDYAWLFACPRFADRAWLSLARGRSVTCNLPYDPVPYLPPSIVEVVGRSPTEIRWTQLLDRLPGSFVLPPFYSAADWGRSLDWAVQLAGGNVVPNLSPHQTYQYLRAAWSLVPQPVRPDVSALYDLCKGLGLLDPWPSTSSTTADPGRLFAEPPRLDPSIARASWLNG